MNTLKNIDVLLREAGFSAEIVSVANDYVTYTDNSGRSIVVDASEETIIVILLDGNRDRNVSVTVEGHSKLDQCRVLISELLA